MRDISALTPSSLMERARQVTGLEDFGPQHFLEPLEILTASMRDEAQLNERGLAAHSARLVNALANRLRRIDLMRRTPEICAQQVDVAVVIVGLPRTGSTMLQRLLCASPKATATYWWETIYPLPRTEIGSEPERLRDIEARKADADQLAKDLVASSAGFDAIHPMNAFAHDEELALIEQSFLSTIPESMLHVPSYGEYLMRADQTEAYGELIDWLKILQWQDPSRRGRKWVLKAPHHLTAVQTVLDVLPEAVLTMTHRRVEHVMGSWYSMVASLTGGNTNTDFSHEQAANWTKRLHDGLTGMFAARAGSESRFVDVHYKSLLSDPIGAASRTFGAAHIPVEDEDEAAWRGWLDANRRDNRPSHKYDVADYGISAESLERDFSFYSDRFDQIGV